MAAGAVAVDVRDVDDYFDVHIPGSISLQYEFGPGMTGRARDCIPLGTQLILLDDDRGIIDEVAAGLRGKGYAVEGVVHDALVAWGTGHGAPASVSVVKSVAPPEGFLFSVGDPGSGLYEGASFIPIEDLWGRTEEVPVDQPIVLIAARGVRAAMAVGMLERAGATDITVWRKT
jgi:rhodanese-related sulfurtransferase